MTCWTDSNWIEQDEARHGDACTDYEIARRAAMEGAPVRGEEGYVEIQTPAESLERIRQPIEDGVLDAMFTGTYD